MKENTIGELWPITPDGVSSSFLIGTKSTEVLCQRTLALMYVGAPSWDFSKNQMGAESAVWFLVEWWSSKRYAWIIDDGGCSRHHVDHVLSSLVTSLASAPELQFSFTRSICDHLPPAIFLGRGWEWEQWAWWWRHFSVRGRAKQRLMSSWPPTALTLGTEMHNICGDLDAVSASYDTCYQCYDTSTEIWKKGPSPSGNF